MCGSSATPLDVEDDISVGTAVRQLDDNPGLLTQALQPVKGTSHTLSLLQQHTTQLSQASCSIASATVALNALSSRGTDILPAPTDPLYQAPYHTPSTVLSQSCSAAVRPAKLLGRTLEQAADIIRCHANSVTAKHANENNSVLALEADLKHAFNDSDKRAPVVIINYNRRTLNGINDNVGHFSPIAALVNHSRDDEQQLALIMDVSRYKHEPHWALLNRVWNAMNTKDDIADSMRGWLVIEPLPENDTAEADNLPVRMPKAPSRSEVENCLLTNATVWRWAQVEECFAYGYVAAPGMPDSSSRSIVSAGATAAAAIACFFGGAGIALVIGWFARKRFDDGRSIIPGAGSLRYQRQNAVEV